MIIQVCDVCGKQSTSQVMPHHWITVTPGVIGEKMLCEGCWANWRKLIISFFTKTGGAA